MSNSQLIALVGDRFQADCQEPKHDMKRNEIVLKRNACCIIIRETNPRELNLIRIRLSEWVINQSNTLKHPKELFCLNCCCDSKDFYKWHTGSDKVKPFIIFRIETSPAFCTIPIFGEIEPFAEIREAVPTS